MLRFFEKDREAIEQELLEYLTPESILNKWYLVALDTREDISELPESDLIFVFNSEGKLLLINERVRKAEIGNRKRIAVVSKILQRVRELKKNEEYACTYYLHGEYYEISYYKKEWYKCIEELSQPSSSYL